MKPHFAFVAVIVVVGWALVALPASEDAKVPETIAAPAGFQKLLLSVEARGVQIYKAEAGDDGKLKWVHQAPVADLFDSKGKKIGYHYAGPSWETLDGSKVAKGESTKAVPVDAPNKSDDVPWLLIKVNSADVMPGTLSDAAYVQRLKTKGGVPPRDAPKRAGTIVGVPYTAEYRFYGKSE